MQLAYYSHRYRDPDPAIQAKNLADAQMRFRHLAPGYRARGYVLHAPWIAFAEAGATEEQALSVIYPAVIASALLVEDFDGNSLESVGMLDERNTALAHGRQVEVVGR